MVAITALANRLPRLLLKAQTMADSALLVTTAQLDQPIQSLAPQGRPA